MKIFKIVMVLLMVSGVFLIGAEEDIHKVVQQGDTAKVKDLLKKDPALVNRKNERGQTPLHIALLRGKKEIAALLIARGADVNAESTSNITPLMLAAFFGHKDAALLLIDKGADMTKAHDSGMTPLLFAVSRGHKEVVELLIDKGAPVNVTDKLGGTPLLIAALSGQKAVVEVLIAKGVDINAANSRGSTPLSVAIREGHNDIAELLRAKGAKQTQKNILTLKGDYLGQARPGLTPLLFAPGFVSTEHGQLNAVFTNNHKEFYFTLSKRGSHFTILVTKRVNGQWTHPETAPFSGKFSDVDHSISPDGKKLFFCSRRPLTKDGEPKKDHDFWVMEQTGTGWSEPRHLGPDVNTDREDYYPTVTAGGTLYFSSQREGEGTNNIYRSLLKDGKYGKAEKLGPAVNSESRDFDPFIAPDESYLIFASERPGGYGASDLYIAFRKADGTWTNAKNMGETINSSSTDYTPMLSPDGKYLFFTSARAGVGDIYWISSKIIPPGGGTL